MHDHISLYTAAIVLHSLKREGKWTPLSDIVGVYEALEKAPLSADVLNIALGSLIGGGYVESSAWKYRLTAKGITLQEMATERSHTAYDALRFLEQELSWSTPPRDFRPITQGEVDRAAKWSNTVLIALIVAATPFIIIALPFVALWHLTKSAVVFLFGLKR
ncbi:MAG: hypothetical protein KF784_13075 [Fimbriimonadaceae bacterium]|nr:hypothetical protein [Fimbriimonadaceae bacterium]